MDGAHREKAMPVDCAEASAGDDQRSGEPGSPVCRHRSCTDLAAGICAIALTSAVGASYGVGD